jgi:hypothetical protein
LPPAIQDWLPERHLARFVVDIVSQLDLHPFAGIYAGKGYTAYHPEILLSLQFYGYLEQQLQAEVDGLIRFAEQADSEEIPEKMDIPEELFRRQDRLKVIAEAKVKIEERAAQRHEQEQKEYEEKAAERRAKSEAIGKKPGGREPKPPTPGPRKNDQVNLTDEESRIMPSSD